VNGGKSFLPYTTFSSLKPGDYTAIVQDSKGCEDSTLLTINNTEKLTIQLDGITSVNIGDDVQIKASVTPDIPALKKITWTPDSLLSCKDCLNPIVKLPKKSIYYQLKVVNENGCEAEAYTSVEVNRKIAVFVPTSFSPNGDNINDRFTAFGDLDLVLKIKWMRVYDRWGETVYEETDINPNDTSKGWDGSFRGEPMNPAVYVWNLEVLFLDGTSKILKGDIMLQR
jgi:gliding motility-associated-like protein